MSQYDCHNNSEPGKGWTLPQLSANRHTQRYENKTWCATRISTWSIVVVVVVVVVVVSVVVVVVVVIIIIIVIVIIVIIIVVVVVVVIVVSCPLGHGVDLPPS